MILTHATPAHRRALVTAPLVLAIALWSACSDDPNSGAGPSGGTSGSGGSGGSSGSGGSGGSSGSAGSGGSSDSGAGSGLFGSFTANLVDADPVSGAPAYTHLIGRIYDGVYPPAMPLKLDREQNGCQVLVPKVSFCSPACSGGVCTDDNLCTLFPMPLSVGTAKVTGLGPMELMLEAATMAKAYQSVEALPNPPCAEGAAVRVQTDRFTLESKCIAPFQLGGDPKEKIPVKAGQSVKLTWTPPGQMGFSRVEVKLDISHHGGKKGEIVCDVPDTGSFEIPEPLVTRLVGLGVAGFPTIVVGRAAEIPAANEPLVKLRLVSSTTRDADTGVISCTSTADCPTGTTCQADLTCR